MIGEYGSMDDRSSHRYCNLSSQDIKECRRELKEILIAPFDESKCKGVGYNLSPSELCYSVNRHCLLRIHRTAQEVYVMIPPHDTVLTLSHEYLQVSSQIAGCFLSRLRPVSKGLGNISTTLDPCWKGMILISINNPSSRKIKLVISQMEQDRLVPVGLTTMLIWRLPQVTGEGDKTLTFRLDNPAMRTDIWTELTAEPYRIIGSKKYKQFQRLIERLSSYSPSNDKPEWILKIQKQLDRLECAIRAHPWQRDTIREILLCINHLESDQMPQALLDRLHKLFDNCGQQTDSFERFQQGLENTLDNLRQEEYIKKYSRDIYLAYQECNYQRLCFQVEEIHKIIREESDYVWPLDRFKRFFHRFVFPNASGIVASIVLILFFILGKQEKPDSYLVKALISMLPILLSFILNRKK